MRLKPMLLLSCLLLGCAAQPPDEQTEVAPPIAQPAQTAQALEPIAAAVGQHQLRGTLLTPPAGSNVELAVLLVDSQGYPRQLLGSTTLTGTGQTLPFSLVFAEQQADAGLRLQLRAQVSLSGQLVQRLPGKSIQPSQQGDLGPLQLVKAP